MALCLPPELWLQVFVHLDSPALAACARLSSHFLHLAQARLFAHVYLLPRRRLPATALSPRYTMSVSRLPDACAKFFHVLSMSPRLARHVKRVSIVDGTLFPSFRTFSDQTLATREKLNGAPWFLSTSPHVLHALFQALNLQSFDLIFQDSPKVSWNIIPRGIRSALDSLLTSPRLHSLQLSNISFDIPSTLHDLTSTLSQGSITHLVLRNVKLYPDSPLPPQAAWKDTSSNTTPLACPAKKQPQPSSWHAKSFSSQTHDPLLPQNQKSYLMHSVLQLETLCITSDPLYLSQQDPDTLHLLSALLSGSTTVLNPCTLERLSIPSVDEETLSKVIWILDEARVSNCSLYV